MLIKISSRLREAHSTSTADFCVNLPFVVKGNWVLRQGIFPNSFYNVDSRNDKVYFVDSAAAPQAVSLEHGYYTTGTLAAALKTAMDTAAGTYTVTHSTVTGKLTVSVDAGTFYFTWGTNSENSAASLLGFSQVDGAGAASHVGERPIQLATLLSFNVSLNGEDSVLVGSDSTATFVVPVSGEVGSVTVYEPTVSYQRVTFDRQGVRHLRVRVIDDNGRILQLHDHELEMTLEQYC